MSLTVASQNRPKRRSKSLDDLVLNTTPSTAAAPQEKQGLYHYSNAFTSTSPIVSFSPVDWEQQAASRSAAEVPVHSRRRHSSSVCGQTNSPKECLRLATIYGWVTASASTSSYYSIPNRSSSSHEENAPGLQTEAPRKQPQQQQKRLHPIVRPSRSFTQDSVSNKLSKMFARSRRKSMGTPTQAKERKDSNETVQPVTEAFGWVVKSVQPILDSNLSVEDDAQKENTPTPPIENEPRVFDLLAADAPSFITYNTLEDGTRMMASATVEKLVEKLTREMDSQFLMDFFLIYRQFLTHIKLCKLLILRFRWALLEDSDERFLVRIRTFVVIRHWLTHYWQKDFEPSRTLRFMLSTFLSEVRLHPTILQSPRDERIIRNLRTLVKQQRKLHTPAHVDPHLPDENNLPDSSIHSSSTLLSSNLFSGSIRRSADSCTSRTTESTDPLYYNDDDNESNRPDSTKPHGARVDSAVVVMVNSSASSTTMSSRLDASTASSVSSASRPWTLRMNSSLKKTIKRSVPSMFTLAPRPSTSTPTPSASLPSQPQRRRQAIDRLSLPKTIHNNSNNGYCPLVLQYRSEIIAQQFCRIEQQLLQHVTWEELIELRWRTRVTEGGVNQLINHFNHTCQWITSEIVRTPTLDMRVRVIEKYIRIANKCYHHRNYSTLMQILLGLQSPAVSRLEKTWQRVSIFEIQTLNELKEIAKPFKNWKNVRAAMSQAIENIAESSAVEAILTGSRQQQPPTAARANSNSSNNSNSHGGCIPFLGLYLSDLVFNAELPTTLSPPSTPSCDGPETEINNLAGVQDSALRSRLTTHLVNYNKHRITASIVRHVLAFQVLSRKYGFDYHPTVYPRLQQLQYLENAEIRNASFVCEE